MFIEQKGLPKKLLKVVIFSKSPTFLLKAVWDGEHFVVIGHWALKKLRPDEVEKWDYLEQSS